MQVFLRMTTNYFSDYVGESGLSILVSKHLSRSIGQIGRISIRCLNNASICRKFCIAKQIS